MIDDYQTKQRKKMIERILMQEKKYTSSDMIEKNIQVFFLAFVLGCLLAFIVCYLIH
jgi:hypothetical protein